MCFIKKKLQVIMFVLEPKLSFSFFTLSAPSPRACKCSFFLSFLANLQVFLESKMAQPQFLALLSDLPAFAVWDLLGHTLHCVANRKHQTWKKTPVG